MEREFETAFLFECKPAGFWIRFWAYLTDLLIAAALSGLLINPLFALSGWSFGEGTWYAPAGILGSLVFYAYFVLMTKFTGQTAGKMIFGIRVKRMDGTPLDWSTVLFREWIGRFFSAVIWPLYLIVAFSPSKKGLHDWIADTAVVHEHAYSKAKAPVTDSQQLRSTGTI